MWSKTFGKIESLYVNHLSLCVCVCVCLSLSLDRFISVRQFMYLPSICLSVFHNLSVCLSVSFFFLQRSPRPPFSQTLLFNSNKLLSDLCYRRKTAYNYYSPPEFVLSLMKLSFFSPFLSSTLYLSCLKSSCRSIFLFTDLSLTRTAKL